MKGSAQIGDGRGDHEGDSNGHHEKVSEAMLPLGVASKLATVDG